MWGYLFGPKAQGPSFSEMPTSKLKACLNKASDCRIGFGGKYYMGDHKGYTFSLFRPLYCFRS